jgi:anti-anti-sigma factor
MNHRSADNFVVRTHQRDDGIVDVIVRGELDVATAPRLHERLRRLPARSVELNLTGLRFVDASGLQGLLATTTELKRRGTRVRCVGCSGPLRRLLALTGTTGRLRGA